MMMMIYWGCLWAWESRREDTLMHPGSWQDHGCVFLVGHCVLWPCQQRQMGPRSNSVYLVSYEFPKQLRVLESQCPLKSKERI